MIQKTLLEAIAQKWFNAFNEHNLEKLLALYDNNATHYSPKLKIRNPETKGLIKGKEALRIWWKDSFERLPSLHYELTTITSDNGRIFMEYIRKANNEADMLIAEVLEVKNGLITASRVYHA